MLKETFPYTDIDGDQSVWTAHFNLTQYEIQGEIELEIIQERFQKFQDEVIGDDDQPRRNLTQPEVRELLEMIKKIIRHAYGIREGKRIRKTDEIWDEFVETGAFSGYLLYLFQNTDKANEFMAGIWPQDAPVSYEEAQAQNARSNLKVVTDESPDPNFSFLGDLDQYQDDYLLKCSDAEFDAIANNFKQGKNLPFRLIQLGMRRGQSE